MKVKVLDESQQYKDYFEAIEGYYAHEEKDDVLSVGDRLKKIRESQNLSLLQFSKLSGIGVNHLTDIENHEACPDLGTLVKISRALRVSSGVLIDDETGYSYSVIRKDDRQKIKRHYSGAKDRPNYIYQSISAGIQERHMEAFIVTLTVDQGSGEMSCHDGEEFIMVMKGVVRVKLGKKEELLKEGDSIYYLSSIPHNVVNNSKNEESVILAVLYTGGR